MFDIPPLYDNCNLSPAECDALEKTKIHEFHHGVDAINSIIVTCLPGERNDGLPDWTWEAEGFKFHRPIPSCYDPTFCPDDPPIPELENAFSNYNPKNKGTYKYEDGEVITYTCANSIYRFPQYDGTHKDDWKDTLDVKCGWGNQWDPPSFFGCVDPRGCKPPPPRTDTIWGSYEDTYGSLDVGMTYWYECRQGYFELPNGTTIKNIDLTCTNPNSDNPPFWVPQGGIQSIDGEDNPFPKCVILRKYISLHKGKANAIAKLGKKQSQMKVEEI